MWSVTPNVTKVSGREGKKGTKKKKKLVVGLMLTLHREGPELIVWYIHDSTFQNSDFLGTYPVPDRQTAAHRSWRW